jgi:small subunit ribosomal protein S20|tara:strand:- start:1468 stop:1728 length:261 start_codon:yes stop_codon:yes gene_type:complete
MANHKSAKKRTRQNIRRNEINRSMLSIIKNNTSSLDSLITSKKINEIHKSFSSLNSSMAKAVKKGLLKKEFMSRKLSSFSNKIKKI